ncbi:MAG: hypothetical protein KDA60_22945, partial [Planctomycetales bacterium]|nr:hypothetical protein [Planctomycetales bacterium]
TPPRYFALPRVSIELPIWERLPQISHSLAIDLLPHTVSVVLVNSPRLQSSLQRDRVWRIDPPARICFWGQAPEYIAHLPGCNAKYVFFDGRERIGLRNRFAVINRFELAKSLDSVWDRPKYLGGLQRLATSS